MKKQNIPKLLRPPPAEPAAAAAFDASLGSFAGVIENHPEAAEVRADASHAVSF